jgi:hypothetical protein
VLILRSLVNTTRHRYDKEARVMELSKINTVVRPRSKWEATDLGFKMASHWFKPLLLSWLMVSLPVFILLQLVLMDYGPAAMLIFWWLKPLFERMGLGYLSFALFGEHSTFKQLFKRWLSLMPRQWLATLTWRRFSPHRSYFLPITQLENLAANQRQRRLRLFDGQNQQASFWLTIIGMHVETVIILATLALAHFLLPGSSPGEGIFDSPILAGLQQSSLITNVLSYIAMAVVAPFYISGGFSLYLNQRTRIEGWDIEITFGQMVERRHNKSHKPAVLSLLTPLLLVLIMGFNSHAVQAIEPSAEQEPLANQEPSADQKQAKRLAQTILKGEQYNQIETHSYPEFALNWTFDQQNDQPEPPQILPPWLRTIVNLIAGSIEVFLTVLVVSLLLLLIYHYRQWLSELISPVNSTSPKIEPAQSVFGLDISQQNILDQPAQKAQLLWQKGQQRQSLSLLYRASLLTLINNQHLTLYDGFTEGECVAQVKQSANLTTANYFARLTQNWQRLAYASIVPQESLMQQLFDEFDSAFKEPTSD